MKGWMLTDEEIQRVVRDVDEQHQGEPFQPMEEEYKAIARAAVKKVVEWLDSDCTEHDPPAYIASLPMERGECIECLMALKQEVGL